MDQPTSLAGGLLAGAAAAVGAWRLFSASRRDVASPPSQPVDVAAVVSEAVQKALAAHAQKMAEQLEAATSESESWRKQYELMAQERDKLNEMDVISDRLLTSLQATISPIPPTEGVLASAQSATTPSACSANTPISYRRGRNSFVVDESGERDRGISVVLPLNGEHGDDEVADAAERALALRLSEVEAEGTRSAELRGREGPVEPAPPTDRVDGDRLVLPPALSQVRPMGQCRLP